MIGQLGLTNFDTAHLKMAMQSGIDVVSNQISYSVIDQRAAQEMTNFCQSNEVDLLAYGTLAGGFLSEEWLEVAEPRIKVLGKWSLLQSKTTIILTNHT